MNTDDDTQLGKVSGEPAAAGYGENVAAIVRWWDDTEARAAEAHAAYQREAHRRGDVRHPDAYADLSEATKEWDRVLVRWVADSIRWGFWRSSDAQGCGRRLKFGGYRCGDETADKTLCFFCDDCRRLAGEKKPEGVSPSEKAARRVPQERDDVDCYELPMWDGPLIGKWIRCTVLRRDDAGFVAAPIPGAQTRTETFRCTDRFEGSSWRWPADAQKAEGVPAMTEYERGRREEREAIAAWLRGELAALDAREKELREYRRDPDVEFASKAEAEFARLVVEQCAFKEIAGYVEAGRHLPPASQEPPK